MSQLNPNAYTVLVVDDTPTNLKVLADYLSAEGFRILVARNGESALKRAEHGQPDIILLDVLMPGINGFETCGRLKANPATEHIPVIFMTALSETEHKVRGFEMGAVDYVTKPIQQAEVLARLQTHLKIRDLTNTLERRVTMRTKELREALQNQQRLTDELSIALSRAEEARMIQGRVINVVSHEFRTPLNVISGSSHLLVNFAERMSVEKRGAVSKRITESISYMTTLLDNVLYTGTMEQESTQVQYNAVDIEALCRRANQLAESQFGKRPIEMSFSDVDELIQSDEQLMMQLMSNLFSNAYKFSAEGESITLNVSQKFGLLVIQLKDMGRGVPVEDQPHIFDLFYRGQNTIGVRGLGLGLSIGKRIVETLGGEISVNSRGEGRGSQFCVQIPIISDMEALHPATMAVLV